MVQMTWATAAALDAAIDFVDYRHGFFQAVDKRDGLCLEGMIRKWAYRPRVSAVMLAVPLERKYTWREFACIESVWGIGFRWLQ